MEPTYDTTWERSLEQVARRFDYPATPDIAAAVRPRTTDRGRQPAGNKLQTGGSGRRSSVGRLAWALIIIALLAAGALAVPQTRAAVLSFFARIGAIDILIDETAPTATPIPSPLPATNESAPTQASAATRTIDHSLSLFRLGEPSSLDEARTATVFPLLIPAALGEPDEIYIHRNVDLPAVSLVWYQPNGAPLSLTEIGIPEFAEKMVREQGVKSLRVGDRPAVWLEGPHRLQLLGNWQESSLEIESNVLIWAADGVTYRLEGDLPEEEMVAIAESLP